MKKNYFIIGNRREATKSCPVIFVTGYHCENLCGGIEQICRARTYLMAWFPDTHFVYPDRLTSRIALLPFTDCAPQRCKFVHTGTLSLDLSVVVMCDTTERAETGANQGIIVEVVSGLLSDRTVFARMSIAVNPAKTAGHAAGLWPRLHGHLRGWLQEEI